MCITYCEINQNLSEVIIISKITEYEASDIFNVNTTKLCFTHLKKWNVSKS